MNKKPITRREFIKDTSVAAVGSAILLGSTKPEPKKKKQESKTDVALIRNNKVLDDSKTPRSEIVLEMLDAAVMALTGEKIPLDAWRHFIKQDDKVGIKTNEWGRLSTTTQVESALKKRVMDIGVAESRVKIKDKNIHSDPFFMGATALINARPMRTHHWSGVGSCLKNVITFVPRPWEYHADSCADLAKLWELPSIKGKVRLNILVMFTPQFHSVGPHSFNPKYLWTYNGLIVGKDPVAVDATGLRIIQAIRGKYFGQEKPLNPPAKHIFLAQTHHGLGIADPNRINLIKIGESSGFLI